MRVLLTGAAGFIGSHLARRLLDMGCEVVGADNLSTGSRRNLDGLRGHPRFRLVECDVTHGVPVDGPFDWILHFASPASPPRYQRLAIETMRVNAEGTYRLLELARATGARFFLASTSEVYGDPLVHPQPESYWGNVNPVGPRSVYDEAKRYAEALTMAYHRMYGVDTRIARIFNSIMGSEYVVLFNDDQMHLEPIGAYADRVRLAPNAPRRVLVPAFDPRSLRMELREARALIRHVAHQDAFELKLRYGRSVRVTGDHSVFVPGPGGKPVPKPVREIRPGDYVLIPAKLPVLERDREWVELAEEIPRFEGADGLWRWAVRHPELAERVAERREDVHQVLVESGRFAPTPNFRNTLVCTTRRWIRTGAVPLYVLRRMGWAIPADAEFGPYGGSNRWLPNRIALTDDLLWLMGLYLAEGAEYSGRGVHFISLSSDAEYLVRAQAILESHFGVQARFFPPKPGRAPSLVVHSKALHILFTQVWGLRKCIPTWVLQLPLRRLKYFLEGFRCGDGTHSGRKVGNELVFETVSEELAIGLGYLLLRFGIVASYGRYETTIPGRRPKRNHPFYRLTVCALDNFDILSWDRGVQQKLNARRTGDLVWAQVREVRPCLLTGYVYDFSVPGAENFVAGNGVCCHNTYGPFMDPADGRVVSTFITQALTGQPLTVYGDGSQTRSFCYVDDLVEGIVRLMDVNHPYPVNLGNPEEFTILQLARLVKELTGSDSPIVFLPLPEDDPRQRRPDITRARELLGWEPRVPLREGLCRTIAWFREVLAEGRGQARVGEVRS